MNVYIYPTDHSWYRFLRAQSSIDEVNFWQPGGGRVFSSLQPGDLFLFRLKSPINMIAGGGVYTHASLYPLDLAWQAFGEKNGTASYAHLRTLIAGYKDVREDTLPDDARIGCIILREPFFLHEEDWLPVPIDYHINLVQGKCYDGGTGTGRALIGAVSASMRRSQLPIISEPSSPESLYGDPMLVKRRLGQGSFRVLVTDNYGRRCAITGEKTLPVLQAAHILPVSKGGHHRSDNGLLLRSDLHTLFDLGYVTVTPDHQFKVSAALRDEYSNGRVYYEMHDRMLNLPPHASDQPSPHFLEWHRERVFRS